MNVKDEKWGDKAYYIEPDRVDRDGVVSIGEVKEVNITKHGRIYNTCDYSGCGTRFDKQTGRQDTQFGLPIKFYPTQDEAVRKRKEYVLWMEMLYHDEIRKFSNFTDEELDTMIDILKGAENRG